VTRRVTAFFGDEEGAVTVEGVLLLPVFAFFLTLTVDTSLADVSTRRRT
jgi:Flp pilus assembly protein TadG